VQPHCGRRTPLLGSEASWPSPWQPGSGTRPTRSPDPAQLRIASDHAPRSPLTPSSSFGF